MRIILFVAGLMAVAAALGYMLRTEDTPEINATIEDAIEFAEGLPPAASCEPFCDEDELDAAPDLPCPYCDQDGERWRDLTSVEPPELLGVAGILMEAECGEVLYALHARERRAPASLVKIVTAISVLENAGLDEMVDVTITGWDLVLENDSSITGLKEGMQLSVEELLYGLLLTSGNDAALQLSEHLGGESHLVGMMNERVQAMGLTDTHIRNSHGLDADGAYSTPFDMAILGRELLREPVLKGMVATEYMEADWHEMGGMWNGNYLMYIYEDAIGIKTGYTELAGWSIVSAAERDGRVLIASVFDSADVYWDSMRLFDWGFENMSSVC